MVRTHQHNGEAGTRHIRGPTVRLEGSDSNGRSCGKIGLDYTRDNVPPAPRSLAPRRRDSLLDARHELAHFGEQELKTRCHRPFQERSSMPAPAIALPPGTPASRARCAAAPRGCRATSRSRTTGYAALGCAPQLSGLLRCVRYIWQCIGERHNGASRDRTDDLRHAMAALSQLSYSPKLAHPIARGPGPSMTGVSCKLTRQLRLREVCNS
jgi:hypothetical protein